MRASRAFSDWVKVTRDRFIHAQLERRGNYVFMRLKARKSYVIPF